MKSTAAKRRYLAVAPDGSLHHRTTTRTYSWAVLANFERYDGPGRGWGMWGFCGSYNLAVKARDQAVRQTGAVPSCFEIVGVIVEKEWPAKATTA